MSHITIDPSLTYTSGTQRVFDEKRTLEIIEKDLKRIGVTRIANITDLDRIGIPVYSAIRPGAASGAISIYSGKGFTHNQARISAMMESFERCLAERASENANIQDDADLINFIDTYENVVQEKVALDPLNLLLPEPINPENLIEWTQGFDLLNDQDCYVPSNAVYHPYNPPGRSHKLFRSNTNGLAAGNVIEEAVLHGILEVIERDALSIAEFNRNPGKEIILTPGDGINYELIQMFHKAGVDIKIWLLPHDTGIPTVVAATDDVHLKDPAMLVMGAGSHLKPEIAIRRALSEAAQSRLVQIHGAREDTDRERFVRQIGYERIKRMNKYWYVDGDTITTEDIQDLSGNSPADNIYTLVKELEGLTDSIVITDLSRKSINVPVVRVIIPGFEQYTLDRERVGKRMKTGKKRRLSREERPWRQRRK
ncbi:methanogenesis marker protein 1 [Methanosalsum zhilinae DSM 4017]|uniref:Methanogenesis marker protein 1 n=1 Tax=Methanosalsum zhilinae (strain DSM 4017 / NBRC 107636 / OCM 62 / WeN5) TaxID=679901 RepID=F7XP63_METZD|nr:YcaO-related McrA-glycine thioamidation protein [Methanosalsum zhilinae]AEH61355.1 methanogenesis marker protein 1 [Methanosalsum zhilinae DSM 4017]